MADYNICLVSRSIYPYPIEKHTQNMQTFEGWLRFFNNVVVVSQCRSKTIKKSQYKNIFGTLLPLIKNRYINVVYFNIYGLIQALRLNKIYRFDIFQASDAGGAFLAYLASRATGAKFVFEVQGDIFGYPNHVGGRMHSFLVKFFSKLIVKKADYVRIVSPFLYDYLDKFNINRSKVFLVPPRCDSLLFDPNNAGDMPDALRNNQFNILFVGNLLIGKGVDTLLEAFALIVAENANVGLVYVGDGEELDQLRSRAKELHVSEKVFFEGRVNYKRIVDYMHYANVLVLPSIHEGFGRVLLEAMSMELPIVASNVGGIPLVVDDNISGLLFEVGGIRSLKKKVLMLINNQDFSKQLVKNANIKFMKNYDYEVSMDKFIKMYQSILES